MESYKIHPCEISSSRCIAVLLSIYRSDASLSRLLESVLNQQDCCIHLFVRFDGDFDSDRRNLAQFGSNSRILEFGGQRLGSKGSFLQLLQIAHKRGFETFAFCDQDDFWYPNKLERALKAFELASHVELYYAAQEVSYVGPRRARIKRTKSNKARPYFENQMRGCTSVFKRAIATQLLSVDADKIVQYDFALYLIGGLSCKIYFDQTATMLYQIHDNNEYGIPSKLKRFERFCKSLCSRKESQMLEQLREITRICKHYRLEIDLEMQQEVECLIKISSMSLFGRTSTAIMVGHVRTNPIEDFVFRLLMIMNRLP